MQWRCGEPRTKTKTGKDTEEEAHRKRHKLTAHFFKPATTQLPKIDHSKSDRGIFSHYCLCLPNITILHSYVTAWSWSNKTPQVFLFFSAVFILNFMWTAFPESYRMNHPLGLRAEPRCCEIKNLFDQMTWSIHPIQVCWGFLLYCVHLCTV